MFNFTVIGTVNGKRKYTVAVTRWRDVADYIADYSKKTMDPDGSKGIEFTVLTNKGATQLYNENAYYKTGGEENRPEE